MSMCEVWSHRTGVLFTSISVQTAVQYNAIIWGLENITLGDSHRDIE